MLIIVFLSFQFGTDVENVVNLVSVPQFFDLEEYGQRRLGKVGKPVKNIHANIF